MKQTIRWSPKFIGQAHGVFEQPLRWVQYQNWRIHNRGYLPVRRRTFAERVARAWAELTQP